MRKEKLTLFALEDGSGEYDFEDDNKKIGDFTDQFGYAFFLTYSSTMIELANTLKDINSTINTLESWKNDKELNFFDIRKTTYEVNWHYSRCKKEKLIVTLPQAIKLYKETKLQYDTLLGVILETYRVHGKKHDGTVYDLNEFLTEIEI